MIDFYYSPTPNGWKVGIMLEECGLEYNTVLLDLSRGEQFGPEFLAISPNAQTPAIVDHDTNGPPIGVFESGAILLYLADKTGRFAPAHGSLATSAERRELMEWLFWQAGSQGPIAGQLSHYVNYARAGQDYPRERHSNQYKRSLTVLENQLQDRDYLLGEYSIADMMSFPWAFVAKNFGIDLSEYPRVSAWREGIKTRPAVRRAIDLHKDKQNLKKRAAQSNPLLYNQDGSQLKPKG
jgi:GST-like protein